MKRNGEAGTCSKSKFITEHSRVEDILIRVQRPRSVRPVREDDEPLCDREQLAGVARGETKRREQAKSCAREMCFLLRVKEERIRESPLLGRERDGVAVSVAAQIEVRTAERWEIRDANAPHGW